MKFLKVGPVMEQPDYQKIDRDSFDRIYPAIEGRVGMSPGELRFLYGLLRRRRPEKILEVGVAEGGGSLLILKAIADRPSARLYSVDISEALYSDPCLKTGYAAAEHSGSGAWILKTGRHLVHAMEEIGPQVDFVVLDAAHKMPGEVLDFLIALPFVTDDCLFVVHDINLPLAHTRGGDACRILMNVVRADKFYPRAGDGPLPTIGAFRLNEQTRREIADVFNSLLVDWPLDDDDCQPPYWNRWGVSLGTAFKTRDFLARHYDEKAAEIFEAAFKHNKYMEQRHYVSRMAVQSAER